MRIIRVLANTVYIPKHWSRYLPEVGDTITGGPLECANHAGHGTAGHVETMRKRIAILDAKYKQSRLALENALKLSGKELERRIRSDYSAIEIRDARAGE